MIQSIERYVGRFRIRENVRTTIEIHGGGLNLDPR